MKHILYTIALLTISLSLQAQCVEGRHSPLKTQGWKSCQTSIGPVDRGDVHWVNYDLGAVYVLDTLHIWNHNAWGETAQGVKRIMIDYSKDGSTWLSAGEVTVAQAQGSWKYVGAQAIVLDNIEAKNVLISVLETYDEEGECAAISEMRWGIGVMDPVHTNEETLASDWSISPNPADQRIYLHGPSDRDIDKIEIYNALGNKMLTVESHNAQGIEIFTWQSGIYYMSIYVDDKVHSKSFVRM